MRNFNYLMYLSLLLIIWTKQFTYAQGTETFESQSSLSTDYADGSFSGETDGVTVNYVHSRNEGLGTSEEYPIEGKGIILRRINEQSSVEFVIPNGVGKFTFEARKAFTGGSNNRILGVYANGELVYTTPTFGGAGEDNTVHKFSTDINLSGPVTVKIAYPQGTATGNKQITIDNVSWTAFSEGSEDTPILTEETFIGTVGIATSFQIQATESPTTYTLVSGDLPSGLTLNTTTGLISGTPTEAGNSSVVLTASNETGTSPEATISFEIAKGTQTVDPEFTNITKDINDAPFDLVASTEQGITINYTSSDTNVATISGNTVTILNVGTTTIHASNEGNDNYNPFDASFTLTVTNDMGIGDFELNSIQVYTNGQNIGIISEKEMIISVELFDLQGKLLHSKKDVNNKQYQIQNLSKGVVIVLVKTQNGIMTSKKILIK